MHVLHVALTLFLRCDRVVGCVFTDSHRSLKSKRILGFVTSTGLVSPVSIGLPSLAFLHQPAVFVLLEAANQPCLLQTFLKLI